MPWQLLSHPLNADTPSYGARERFSSRPTSSICEGHTANSSEWQFPNHLGTHVDVPYHFSEQGMKLDDFEASFWHFGNVALLTRQVGAGTLIQPDGWEDQVSKDCDLILVKTGFEATRNSDAYWNSNPGLHPEVGAWLRQHRPNVRAIGFDFISVTSWLHREVGREAHRALLDPTRAGRPVLPIEDMKFSLLARPPSEVLVSPLFVSGADGGPVTVWAKSG